MESGAVTVSGTVFGTDSSNSAYATTWYDQSGSGNDATQTTAASQPLLIRAGVTNTENGKAALSFDGTDDEFDVAYEPSTATNSIFGVVAADSTSADALWVQLTNITAGDGISVGQGGLGTAAEWGLRLYENGDVDTSGIAMTTDQTLLTGLTIAATSAQIYANGVAGALSTSARLDMNDGTTIGVHTVGNRYFAGNIQETVFYGLDQTANRIGIEENITDGWCMPYPTKPIVSECMPTPAAAYSLRSLDGSTSTNVVRLRRASDNAESDFTAADLVGSVEGAELITNGGFDTDSDWVKGTGWTISGGQASITSPVVAAGISQTPLAGYDGVYSIFKHTFEIVTCSDYTQSYIRAGNKNIPFSGLGISAPGTYTVMIDNRAVTTSFNTIRFTVLSGVDLTLDNVSVKLYTPTAAELWVIEDGVEGQNGVVVTSQANTALVTTLYDQASTNDATQSTSTAQPKLITAGVTELENGKPAMVFDGVDDYLDITTNPLTVLDNLMVAVVTKPLGTTGEYGLTLSEPNQRIYVPYLSTGDMGIGYDDSATKLVDGAITNDQQLLTLSVDASTASGFKNGAAFSTTPTATADSGGVSETFGNVPQIGAYGGGGSWTGTFQEIIIYDSDQTANRTILETNINDHYGIY